LGTPERQTVIRTSLGDRCGLLQKEAPISVKYDTWTKENVLSGIQVGSWIAVGRIGNSLPFLNPKYAMTGKLIPRHRTGLSKPRAGNRDYLRPQFGP
jgi:hypothetical protein